MKKFDIITETDARVLARGETVELARGGHITPLAADTLKERRIMDVRDFVDAVERVARGGTALDPDVVAQLVSRGGDDGPLSELTPREREVLGLMAEGRSNQAIAESLVITLRAVEKHVTSIFSKLRLPASAEDHRRVLAVLTYLQD